MNDLEERLREHLARTAGTVVVSSDAWDEQRRRRQRGRSRWPGPLLVAALVIAITAVIGLAVSTRQDAHQADPRPGPDGPTLPSSRCDGAVWASVAPYGGRSIDVAIDDGVFCSRSATGTAATGPVPDEAGGLRFWAESGDPYEWIIAGAVDDSVTTVTITWQDGSGMSLAQSDLAPVGDLRVFAMPARGPSTVRLMSGETELRTVEVSPPPGAKAGFGGQTAGCPTAPDVERSGRSAGVASDAVSASLTDGVYCVGFAGVKLGLALPVDFGETTVRWQRGWVVGIASDRVESVEIRTANDEWQIHTGDSDSGAMDLGNGWAFALRVPEDAGSAVFRSRNGDGGGDHTVPMDLSGTGEDDAPFTRIGAEAASCPPGREPKSQVGGSEILMAPANARYRTFDDGVVCVQADRLADGMKMTPGRPYAVVLRGGADPYLWGAVTPTVGELRITVDGRSIRYFTGHSEPQPGTDHLGPTGGGLTFFAGPLFENADTVLVQAFDASGSEIGSERLAVSTAGTQLAMPAMPCDPTVPLTDPVRLSVSTLDRAHAASANLGQTEIDGHRYLCLRVDGPDGPSSDSLAADATDGDGVLHAAAPGSNQSEGYVWGAVSADVTTLHVTLIDGTAFTSEPDDLVPLPDGTQGFVLVRPGPAAAAGQIRALDSAGNQVGETVTLN